MAISITNIGTQVGLTSGITGVTVPSGATIVVCWMDNSNTGTGQAVSDSASNTYTLVNGVGLNGSNTNGRGGWHYSATGGALSSGTISFSSFTSLGASIATAMYLTGVAASPLDSGTKKTASGNSTSPSVTALAAPAVANSLFIGFFATGQDISSFTQDSSHAAYATPPNLVHNASSPCTIGGGSVVSSSQLTYAPTMPSSQFWAALIAAFKPDGNASVTLTGQAATGSVTAPTVSIVRGTYVLSGSRAGIGSAVVTDSESTQTDMLAGIGAEADLVNAEVNLTGQSSSTALGSLSITLSANVTLTGVSSSTALGSLTVNASTSANVNLTGVAATGSVGSPSIEVDASVTLTGVSSSTAPGSLSVEDDVSLTGVSSSTALGSLSVEADGSFTLTGVSSTADVGSPSVQTTGAISLTGVAATSGLGSLSPELDETLTGQAATGSVGTFAITDDKALSGVSSSTAVGSLGIQATTSVSITGVAASPAVGTPTIRLSASVTLTGVEATGDVGTVDPTLLALPSLLITAQIGTLETATQNATLVGVQIAGFVGQPLVVTSPNFTNISLSGITITSGIGSPTHSIGITPTGVSAAAQIGTIGEAIHNTGLMLTDVECLVENTLPDDFEVTLRWSDTDGYSWSDSAIRSIGATGAYLTSPQWRRLGMARRQRVFELSWSCPKATALAGATVQFEDAGT